MSRRQFGWKRSFPENHLYQTPEKSSQMNYRGIFDHFGCSWVFLPLTCGQNDDQNNLKARKYSFKKVIFLAFIKKSNFSQNACPKQEQLP